MNQRIKKVRKALDLTQQEFANKLNIKRNTVATYETGKSNPSDAAVNLICRTFNVSETWLRTGEGEMFVKPSEFSLDDLAKQCNASEIDLKIVKKYFELPDNIRRMLVDHFKSIFVEESTEHERTAGQKKPILGNRDGLENTEERLMEYVPHLAPGQKQMLADYAQSMLEQQIESTSSDVPLTTDDTTPESEHPDQS